MTTSNERPGGAERDAADICAKWGVEALTTEQRADLQRFCAAALRSAHQAPQAEPLQRPTSLQVWGESVERSAPQAAEQGEQPVGFRCRRVGSTFDWTYIDHRAPDSFELRECEIENIYTRPQPSPPQAEEK